MGADGKPRQLHIEKAIDVTRLAPATRPCGRPQAKPEAFDGGSVLPLASCDYFTVKEMEVTSHAALMADEKSFHSLLLLDGSLTLSMGGEKLEMKKGASVFVPAGSGDYTLTGKGRLILTTV